MPTTCFTHHILCILVLSVNVLAGSTAEGAFIEQWAPVLQALAKLSELKVFKSETEWVAAAQAAPVAVVGEARLCGPSSPPASRVSRL